MTRIAMLLGSFLVTFALLISGWSLVSGKPLFQAPTVPPTAPPTADVTPTPEVVLTLLPTAVPTIPTTPSPTASPTPTPLSQPSPSPAPFRTPQPTAAPIPSGSSGTQTITLTGAQFSSSDVPDSGQLARNGDLAVLRTTANSADALWVIYKLDPAQLPAGTTIYSVDTAICGQGSGDFWEVYGPSGSDPAEYEVVPPSADGCWHFAGAPAADDISAIAVVMIQSQLIIERVVFTVHTAQ